MQMEGFGFLGGASNSELSLRISVFLCVSALDKTCKTITAEAQKTQRSRRVDERKEFRNSPKRFGMNARGFSFRTPDLFEESHRLFWVKGKRFLVDNVKLLLRTQTP
jgi:hypothetical protein